MRKIVYILGAGFSAPFSIPITSEFLDRAKDLFQEKEKYSHFKEVIEIIDKYYVTKKWYKIDLDNIEDLLSMMEMKRNLENTDDNSTFKKFIIDVINAYTPNYGKDRIGEVIAYPNRRWDEFLFEFDTPQRNNLLKFVSALFNVKYLMNEKPILNEKNNTDTYNIKSELVEKPLICNLITLNYDIILENALTYLNSFTGIDMEFTETCDGEINYDKVYLAKLHGGVNTEVVPPTWNKYVNKYFVKTWGLAYKLLSDANKIIIIGYSLPETDNYIRYLLALSAVNSFNLKSIDIICKDNSGVVFNRYKKYMNIEDDRISFYNTTTEYYLGFFNNFPLYYSRKNGDEQDTQFSVGLAHSNFIERSQGLRVK